MNEFESHVIDCLSGNANATREASEAMRSATQRIRRDDEVFDLLYDEFVDEQDYASDTGANRAMRIIGWIEYARGLRSAP